MVNTLLDADSSTAMALLLLSRDRKMAIESSNFDFKPYSGVEGVAIDQ